jgi:hypothetical protein
MVIKSTLYTLVGYNNVKIIVGLISAMYKPIDYIYFSVTLWTERKIYRPRLIGIIRPIPTGDVAPKKIRYPRFYEKGILSAPHRFKTPNSVHLVTNGVQKQKLSLASCHGPASRENTTEDKRHIKKVIRAGKLCGSMMLPPTCSV